jgi:hypothetical protein
MEHPDFRVGGKIFATLGAPSDEWGMVKLTPEQQKAFCDTDGSAFQPCNGAWGRQGCTYVRLAVVKTAVVRTALSLAVENVAESGRKSASKQPAVKRQSKPSKPPSDSASAKTNSLSTPRKH